MFGGKAPDVSGVHRRHQRVYRQSHEGRDSNGQDLPAQPVVLALRAGLTVAVRANWQVGVDPTVCIS